MLTYEDLLVRFSKVAEDLGSGGVLPSKADVNLAQNAPSHDAKEKADLPDAEPQKHTFEDGKVKKGPEALKPNKNVFMTRTKDSTIKQAEEAFMAGFQGETEELDLHGAFMRGLLDELEKDASISRETFPGRKIPKGFIKRTLARIVSPTVAGRASSASTLRAVRKLYKMLGLPHFTSHITREFMKGKGHRRLSNIQFAVNRLAGAGLLGGGVALGAKMLRKKKKSADEKSGKK